MALSKTANNHIALSKYLHKFQCHQPIGMVVHVCKSCAKNKDHLISDYILGIQIFLDKEKFMCYEYVNLQHVNGHLCI